jgi:radical SAM superfamily enzyme YgiQ (UPF0313 family)
MKILLVYTTINWHQSGYNYGLGYIASVLKQKGHNIDYFIIDNHNEIQVLYEQLRTRQPDITAFYVTTSQFIYLKEIIPEIKKISKSFIVCGGPYPTLKPECILEIPELDAILRGEGEYPMLDLTEALKSKKDHLLIKNFWFRTKDGIVKNELRPLINDLDELPFPDKSALDYQQEIDLHGGINRFIFSRGCKFECTYCSNKAFTDIYKKTYYRVLSPEKAIAQIESDAAKYKFKSIIFDDDTINLDPKWFFEFFALYNKKFKYPFICNMRPELVNPEAIRLLKEGGVKGIWIGVEHGNETFRKTILKRNITNDEIANAFELIHKNNIRCYAQIMVGFPFENKALFLETVKLCRKLQTSEARSISIFTPYPSTELGNICEENNWLPDRMEYFERNQATISYPGFSKEEIQMCADVFPLLIRFKFIPLIIPLYIIYYPLACPIKLIHSLWHAITNGYRKSSHSRKKEILFICDVSMDYKNAQTTHIIELFNNMSKVVDVSLFTPKPKEKNLRFPNIKYIPSLPIPTFGLLFYQISLFSKLYNYCIKTNVAAFYVRQSDFTFIPLILSKYFRIPYFIEVNGLITDEMKMLGVSKLRIALTKLSEKLGYENAVKIVAVSPGVKDGIIELYKIPEEKIVVIGNGANIDKFSPINKENVKKELKLDQDISYVCFVGHLVPWQGIEYLIQAAPPILASCPNTNFLIVGDGIMKDKWIRQAKELGVNNKFIFTGNVPYEKVPLYINASDVCVAPFIKKRNMKIGLSPLKIFEYLACEKPIVSSNIPNLEFIEQQNVGILVRPEDPEELAQSIIKLMKDKKLREEMGKNGRVYVAKNHNWEAIGRKIAQICTDSPVKSSR